MDPITAITAANAAIALLRVLIPEIQAMANKNQITVEQQAKVLSDFAALKALVDSGDAFKGPEWEVRPNP